MLDVGCCTGEVKWCCVKKRKSQVVPVVHKHSFSLRSMGTRPPNNNNLVARFIAVRSCLLSMDAIVSSSRTSAPYCCCQEQHHSRFVVSVGNDDDCGRRNNGVIIPRTECHDESLVALASVSAAVAIEEGGGETCSFNYWRVLNSISSIMFDNHTANNMTGSCRQQSQRQREQRGVDLITNKYYTLSEVQTHNTIDSAWILVGNTIYDVTSYISTHPGGASSILRKSGGVEDCTRDLYFHSKRAQQRWKRYQVGMLLT